MNGVVPELKKISKNKASTFFGFCDYHDTELFKPIEHSDFINDSLQNFLFAFRAFAIEYHKKIRKLENIRNIFRINPAALLSPESVYIYRNAQLDAKDEELEYNKFKNDYENMNFDNIITFYRKLDFEIQFAVSSSFAVKDDLKGKIINDIYSNKEEYLPSIYLNVYPINGGTNVIISYHKDDEDTYKEYFNQLESLSNDELMKYLNFLIIEYTENIFFSLNFIEKLSEEQKESLLRSFQSSIMVLERIFLMSEDNYYNFDLFNQSTN